MDSRLLTISFFILALEVGVLLGDLGFIPYSFFEFQKTEELQKQSLGNIEQLTNNVRRKLEHSFIWEESEKEESLYAYDSILTLENSTAKVKLDGDIQIKLYENTLIVIEPTLNTNKNDKSIHLKFSKGDLRSVLKNKELMLSSKNWNFKAQKGSDIAFRNLKGDELEIEVNKGSVQLKNKKEPNKRIEIKSGTSVELNSEGLGKQYKKSIDIKWENNISRKKEYSYKSSKTIDIAWKGKAKSIQITHPSKEKEILTLAEDQQSVSLNLPHGQYFIKLLNAEQASESMSLLVLPAPKLAYIFPFPRNRIINHKQNLFSWRKVENVKQYNLELSRDENFEKIHESYVSKTTNITTNIHNRGPLYWRVVAQDTDGAKIVGKESRLTYSISDALAAPVLKELKKSRLPASKKNKQKRKSKKKIKKKKDISFYLEKLYHLLVPKLYAEERSSEFLYEFQWEKVEGADFYIIEISETNNFTHVIETDTAKNISKYTWKSSHTGNVFWRVAGGSNDGKMGLFSEAQKVNLSSIEIKAAEKIIIPSPIKITDLPEAKPQKPKKKFLVVEESEVLETHLPKKIEERNKVTNYDTHIGIEFGVGYSKKKGKLLKENSSYTYDGLNPLAFQAYYGKFNESENRYSYRLQLEYYRTEWEAEKKNLLSFQNKITENNTKILLYLFNKKNRDIGLYFQSKSMPKRAGNEKMDFELHSFVGFAYKQNFQSKMDELDVYHLDFRVSHSEVYTEVSGEVKAIWDLRNSPNYSMGFTNTLRFDLGVDSKTDKASHTWEYLMGLKIDWIFP